MLDAPRTYVPRAPTVEVMRWTGRYEVSLREWLAPYNIESGEEGPFWRRMGYLSMEAGSLKSMQRLDRGDWFVKDGHGRVMVVDEDRLNRMFIQVAAVEKTEPETVPDAAPDYRIPPMYAITLVDPSGTYGEHKLFYELGETAKDAETSALARYRVPGTALNPDRPTVLVSPAREA